VQVQASNTWGTSAKSGGLSARDALAPSQMAMPASSVGAAQINLSWSAPASNGCPITSYTFTSNPAGLGSSTTGTSVSISQNTCAYTSTGAGGTSSQNCARSWTFAVQATNAVGTGTLSASTGSLRPLVSYVSDNVVGIWTTVPSGACTGCHTAAAGNPLHLDGTSAQSLASIVANSPPVIQSPVANSYLLLCPTNQSGCNPTGTNSHPGGFRFATTAPEFTVIQQWLNDGHLN
jgi:hypothetical protein